MEITVKNLLDWIRKGIVFILIISFLFAVGSFVYTKYFVKPTYQASVKFFADGEIGGDTYDFYQKQYFREVAPQYQEFLKVPEFYKMVSEYLEEESDLYLHPDQVMASIRFTEIVEDTSVFSAVISASSPTLAQEIAIAVQKVAPERVKLCDETAELVVLSEPILPSAPSSPSIVKNTALGLLVGMILSVLVVVLREVLDNRIKSPEEITELFDLPVFGVVPDFSADTAKGGRKE